MQLVDFSRSPSVECLRDTLQQVLSSSRQLREQFQAQLSSIPAHPYVKLLHQYFKPNEQFLKIEDVPLPVNFDPLTITNQISCISKQIHESAIQQANSLTAEEVSEVCNAFAYLSGDQFVVDEQKVKNHLNFIEMAKAIPLDMIEKYPKDVAQKVLTEFVRLYS